MGNLQGDFPLEIPFAAEAFGNEPDAVNLWVGDDRSVTTCHKDGYENIYCVVSGAKHFTLCPPVDYPFMGLNQYPVAKFNRVSPGSFSVTKKGGVVPWVSIDPSNPEQARAQHELFRLAHPIDVTVRPGEMLYLPAMWYHHVK
jgi:hypothetical protein